MKECLYNDLRLVLVGIGIPKERVKKYILGLEIGLRQVNKKSVNKFLIEYVELLRNSKSKILSIELVKLIYRNYLIDEVFCSQLLQLSKRIKVDSEMFWKVVIKKAYRLSPSKREIDLRFYLVRKLFEDKSMNSSDVEIRISMVKYFMQINLKEEDYSKSNIANYRSLRLCYILFREFSQEFNSKSDFDIKVNRMFLSRLDTKFKEFENSPQFLDFVECLLRHSTYEFFYRYSIDCIQFLYRAYKVNKDVFEKAPIKEESNKTIRLQDYFFRPYMVSWVMIDHCFTMSKKEEKWFFHDLKGKSLIKLKDTPVKLSKKAVHVFKNLPENTLLSIPRAMIYSKIISLGVQESDAYEMAEWISDLKSAEFWVKIADILYKLGFSYESEYANDVLDYISYIEFNTNKKVEWKRKKLSKLISESHQWHIDMANEEWDKWRANQRFKKSALPVYDIECEHGQYVVRQLLNSKELSTEGKVLHHCVSSYASICKKGISEIFSLRKIDAENKEKPLITIEISGGRIRQAKGNYNRSPTVMEEELINSWFTAYSNKININKAA